MIRDVLENALRTALDKLGVERARGRSRLERPARREHGDWSSNVALATRQGAPSGTRGSWPAQLAEVLDRRPAGARDRGSRWPGPGS